MGENTTGASNASLVIQAFNYQSADGNKQPTQSFYAFDGYTGLGIIVDVLPSLTKRVGIFWRFAGFMDSIFYDPDLSILLSDDPAWVANTPVTSIPITGTTTTTGRNCIPVTGTTTEQSSTLPIEESSDSSAKKKRNRNIAIAVLVPLAIIAVVGIIVTALYLKKRDAKRADAEIDRKAN